PLHEASSGEDGAAGARIRRRRLARAGGRANVLPAPRGDARAQARATTERARGLSLYVDDRRVPRALVLRPLPAGIAARTGYFLAQARARRGTESSRRRRSPTRDRGRAQRGTHGRVRRLRKGPVQPSPGRDAARGDLSGGANTPSHMPAS